MENSKWYDHWLNPIANYNEPWPPAGFRPHIVGWKRKLLWWVRNPLHNFMFFWIGVHGRVIKRVDSIWNPMGGFRFSVVHTKLLKLPLVSYRGKYIEWYFGWRPNGGFGPLWPRKANSKNAPDVR